VVLGLGAFLVYRAIGWFRTDNAEREEVIQAAQASTIPATAPEIFESSAAITRTDGSTAGTVYRRGTNEVPSFTMTVTLAALPPDSSYGIWMVKDGLADVQFAGTLNPRADGSFAQTFSIKDAIEYQNVVIMTEPNDSNPAPSGSIAAQGRFQ
jgi:hypothetical protein